MEHSCRVCGFQGKFEEEVVYTSIYVGYIDMLIEGQYWDVVNSVQLTESRLSTCPECRVAYQFKQE